MGKQNLVVLNFEGEGKNRKRVWIKTKHGIHDATMFGTSLKIRFLCNFFEIVCGFKYLQLFVSCQTKLGYAWPETICILPSQPIKSLSHETVLWLIIIANCLYVKNISVQLSCYLGILVSLACAIKQENGKQALFQKFLEIRFQKWNKMSSDVVPKFSVW